MQGFQQGFKERGVASQVTPCGSSATAWRKLDLSKEVTLNGLMGKVSSDIRDRTASLEGLSLNGATAPPAEDMLEQEMFELEETTSGFGVGEQEH